MLLCLTVALDSLKRSSASAARWRHLELRAGKAAPSAGLVAISAGRPAFAAEQQQPSEASREKRMFVYQARGTSPAIEGPYLAIAVLLFPGRRSFGEHAN